MLLKRSKTIFGILALILVLAFALSACGSGASAGNVLRVGVDDSYPPMEFKDESGKQVGFDIDLANEIGKRLSMKVEFISTAWSGIFTALEADKYDCIISSLSITEDRKKSLLFTQPYVANSQVIVVAKGDTSIASEKDLKDKIVGVQMGTTAEEACVKYQESIKFKDFKKYEQVIEPFADLKTGRINAIVVDEVVARYYLQKDNSSFQLAGGRLTNEPIGIGFKLSNTALKDKVDKAISDIIADGTLKQLSQKWFGEDLTGNLK